MMRDESDDVFKEPFGKDIHFILKSKIKPK